MTDKHFTPDTSQEFHEWEYWRNETLKGKLETFRCIAAWSDICGFGNELKVAEWDLSKLSNGGMFKALSEAYSILGHPFIVGVPPMPSERVLVINDGIARTTDLIDKRYIQYNQLLFYVRDLLMNHFLLERNLVRNDLGLRTVLAGGERCQYSPQKSTGKSFLHYTNEPSDHGKELLEQQYVYNPAEFQMNTAFALAYSIDSLGSKHGVIPNRVYIEESWIKMLNNVIPEEILLDDGKINFMWEGSPGITITYDDSLRIKEKGFETTVFRVSKFVVHEILEGERTEFPMSEHDRKA